MSSSQTPNAWAKPPSIVKLPTGKASDSSQSTATPAQTSSNPHPPSNPPKGNPSQPTPNVTTNKQPPTNVATSLISSSSVPSSTGNGNSGSGKNIKFGANVASSTPSPAASGNGSGNANDMRSNGRAWSNGSGWSNNEDQRNQQRGHQNRGRPHQSNKRRGSFNSQQSTQSQQSNQRTGQSSAPVSLPQPPTTATSIKFGTVETTLPSATSVNKENAPKNQTAQETRQQAWGSSNQSVSSKEVNQTKVGTKQSIESASQTNETSAQEHTTGSEIADSDSKILAPVARQPSVKTFDKIPRVRSTPPVPSANGYVPPIQGFNAKPSNLRPSQPHLSGDAVGSSDLPQQQVSTPFSQQPTSVSSHAPAASSAQAPSHIHNPSSHIPQTSHHTYQSNPSFHQGQTRSYKSQHPRGVKAGHPSSNPATHSIPPTNIHGAPIPGSNTVTPAVPSVYPGAVPAPMQPNVYPMNMPGYGYQQPYTAAYDPAQYQYYPYYPTMPNPVQASQPQPAPIPTSGNRVIPSSAPFYSTSPSSSFAVPPQPKPQPVERSKSKSSAIRITNPNTGETYSPSELAAKAQSPKKEPVIPIPASVATPPTKPVIASEPAPDSTMRKSKAIPIRRPDEGAKNEDGITTGENSGDAASVKSLPIERSEKSPTRGKSPEKSKSPKRTPSPVKVTAKSDVSETEKPLKDTNTLEKKEISKENKAADEERTPSPAKAKSVERSALPKKQQSAEQSISTESIKGEVIDVKERGRSPTRSPPLPTQPSTPPAPTPQSPAKSTSRSRSKSPTKTPASENFEQKCRRMYPDGVVPAPENIILKNKREVCRYAKDFLVQFQPLCEAMPKLLVDLGIFASSNKSGGGMGGRQSSGGRRQTQAANRSGGLGGLGSLQAQARSRPDQPASKLSSAERFAQSLASNMTRQPSMGRDGSRGGRGRDDSHGMDRQRSNRDRKNRGQQQNVALNMPPLEDYAPLEKSENRWTPGMKVSGQLSEEEIANQKLGRKAKGLLNKITLDNFERVSKQIVDIGVTTISGLKTVIDEIFAKATDEANFASIYAMLCLKLYQEMKPVQELSEEDNKRVFRKLLLSQCQSGFENLPKWTQTEEEKQELSEAGITEDADGPEESKKDESSAKKSSDTNEDEYEQMQKIKRRALGNITFIGELFKKGLLTEKIMHTCVQRLISNTDEEYIEALCKLLTTVGASLEHQKSKNLIDHYFERMVKIQSLTTLGSRIQFMIQDVIDLRANKWVLRTVVAASGPKTIAQIRQEASRQNEESRRSSGGGNRSLPTLDQQLGRRDSRRDDERRSSRGTRGGRGDSDRRDRDADKRDAKIDEWISVGTSKVSSVQKDKTHTLRPKTVFNFSSSSQSSTESIKTPDEGQAMSRSGSSNNIFQILEDSERRKSVDGSVAQSDIQGNAPEDVEPEEPNVKELTEEECKEEFEKKVKSLFEVREVDELIDDLKKLNASQYHDSLLEVLLNLAFDRKEIEVELVVKFLEKAISEDVIQPNNIVAALNNIMEVYTDIVMDVPKLPNLMGLLLSLLLSADILEVETVKSYIIQLSSQGLIPPSIKLGSKLVQGLLQQSWNVERIKSNFPVAMFFSSAKKEDKQFQQGQLSRNIDLENATDVIAQLLG